MSPGRDVAHRHEEGVGDAGGLILPWLADVQEDGGIGLLAALGKDFYGNFGLKHVFKDILRDGIKHRFRGTELRASGDKAQGFGCIDVCDTRGVLGWERY